MPKFGASELPVVLRPSRARVVALLAVSLAFVAGGFWLAVAHPFVAYANVVFFGICAAVALVQLHPKSSYLVLREDAFLICALFRKHEVRWRDVESFTVARVGATHMVVGWSHAPALRSSGRLGALNRAISGIDANLPDTYGMKPQELAALLNEMHTQLVAVEA